MRTVKLKVQLQYSSAYHVDIVCHLNIAYCIFMLYMYYECIDMYCICFTGVKHLSITKNTPKKPLNKLAERLAEMVMS